MYKFDFDYDQILLLSLESLSRIE